MAGEQSFVTSLPVQVYVRPQGTAEDWREIEGGPGFIAIPEGMAVMLKVKGIGDKKLADLAVEAGSLQGLTALNLAENRGITDAGLESLKAFSGLTWLNLSSCSLTSTGLEALTVLTRLQHLDLSYCNRLTDAALRPIRRLPNLETLNLQGCVKITHGGVARINRPGLAVTK